MSLYIISYENSIQLSTAKVLKVNKPIFSIYHQPTKFIFKP